MSSLVIVLLAIARACYSRILEVGDIKQMRACIDF
jgi:hypothetical protein